MTVSLVIIMFELTGALTYVLPIMIVGKKRRRLGLYVKQRGIWCLLSARY